MSRGHETALYIQEEVDYQEIMPIGYTKKNIWVKNHARKGQ